MIEFNGKSHIDSLRTYSKSLEENKRKLKHSDKLNFFLDVCNYQYKHEKLFMWDINIGLNKHQDSIIVSYASMEAFLIDIYINNFEGVEKYTAIKKRYLEAKIVNIEYFIKNYKNKTYEDMIAEILKINDINRFFKELSDKTNVGMYFDIVYEIFAHNILSKLYALVELYSEAINSLRKSSFLCGMLEGGHGLISDDKAKEFFKTRLSKANQKRILDYWRPINEIREKRKAHYLSIFREKGFTKYSDAAEYIYDNANLENRGYRQIYDELREADKMGKKHTR